MLLPTISRLKRLLNPRNSSRIVLIAHAVKVVKLFRRFEQEGKQIDEVDNVYPPAPNLLHLRP